MYGWKTEMKEFLGV
ncbi:rCG23362 [Rattus norvegicus]|uniref:RCG23362 n=1 Tax=Rattus norvegicus TaxID=10116 RepID=A6KHB0_RAT|nr:rCG23362 [Rattus norvegicus]